MSEQIKSKQSYLKVLMTIFVILVFVYFFPRFIVGKLGEANPWTSYFYQYGLGLVTFLIGLYVILKSKACQLHIQRDRFWFYILLGGFVLCASIHAIWILLAQHIPYLGG